MPFSSPELLFLTAGKNCVSNLRGLRQGDFADILEGKEKREDLDVSLVLGSNGMHSGLTAYLHSHKTQF